MTAAGRGPEDGVVWGIVGEGSIEIGQKDQRLRVDSARIEPIEARSEIGAAAADGVEMKRLAGRVGINLVDLGVEVISP